MKRSLIVAVAVFALVALGGAAPAFAEPAWAPAGSAKIQPGNQTVAEASHGRPTSSSTAAARTRPTSARRPTAPVPGAATATDGCDSRLRTRCRCAHR